MSKVSDPEDDYYIRPELESLLALADDLEHLARDYPPAAHFASLVLQRVTDMVKREPLADEGGD